MTPDTGGVARQGLATTPTAPRSTHANVGMLQEDIDQAGDFAHATAVVRGWPAAGIVRLHGTVKSSAPHCCGRSPGAHHLLEPDQRPATAIH